MFSGAIRRLFPSIRSLPYGMQQRKPQRCRPMCEQLDERIVPANFRVTSLADSGVGTLRDALTTLNANPGEHHIYFDVRGTITLQSALPDVTTNIDIWGPGASNLTIERSTAAGTPQFALFTNATMGNDLYMWDLTLRGGNNSGFGGAITNWGCVELTRVVVANNTAAAHGGAIYSGSGTMLELDRCTFSNNAGIYGGAVYSMGTTIIEDCVFTGNNGFNGGAIYTFFGSLNIDDTTFSNNLAHTTGAGGAIYSSHGPMVVTDTTFANNVGQLGGAVFIAGFGGDSLDAKNCTFVGNSAHQGGALYNGYFSFQGTIVNSTFSGNYVDETGNGGAVWVGSGTGSTVFTNTIIAGNKRGTGPTATNNDIEGLLSFPQLSAYNLIGDGSLSNLVNGVNGNIVGTAASPINALLGPLQNNGGPTQTLALLAGSPALNTGLNSAAPAADQRGLARIVGGTVDIGAYEQQAAPANQAPTVASPASATPSPVVGTTTNLSVLGADDAGEAGLTYNWSLVSGPGAVFFAANNSNAAKNTTATFTQAGAYTFRATITDAGGLSVTSNVTVTVHQTLTSMAVAPGAVTLSSGGTQQFTATGRDQFGAVLVVQPAFTWSLLSGVGSVNSVGLYSAPATGGGSAVVRASSGAVSATATMTVNAVNQAPTVASPASANPTPVTGTTANLSVLGADDNGEANLTYAWSVIGGPSGVSFSANGNNAAKNATATFIQAGTYNLRATITDAGGLSTTSNVSVIVNQTLTNIAVTPGAATLSSGGAQQFTATGRDQFGNELATQPAFTWSLVSGVGSVNSAGLYSAPSVGGGSAVIRASSGAVSATASVTVIAVNQAPTVASAASASPAPVTGTTTNVSVLGADDNGEANLTYTWSVVGGPSGVTFSANGNNAAKNAVATFTQAGTYTFRATITDAGGLSATSNVNVTVNQTLTTIAVAPGTATLSSGGTQQFTATGRDQFGNVLAVQPTFTWSLVSGIGGVNGTGLYTAPATGSGSAVVRASSGAVNGTATVTVTAASPGINWDTLPGGNLVPTAFRTAFNAVWPAGATAVSASGIAGRSTSTFYVIGFDSLGRQFYLIGTSINGGPINTFFSYS